LVDERDVVLDVKAGKGWTQVMPAAVAAVAL
jgi:hypothetical protein